MPRKYVLFALIVACGVALDQVTKIAVYTSLAPISGPNPGRIVLIPGVLDIIHAQNPGAAFSFLAGFEYRYIVFLCFIVFALAFVAWNMRQLADDDRWRATALALIASGAVGNGIDRLHKRTVTDFIRMYVDADPVRSWLVDWFGTYEWPTYNVADIALFFGIILLIGMGDPEPEASDAPTPDPVGPAPGAPSDAGTA